MRTVTFCLFLSLATCNFGLGQENSARKGATIAEARAVLDLSREKFAQAIGEPEVGVAFQSFKTKGISNEVAKSIDGQLKNLGLKQLPEASFTDSYSSVKYKKSAFHFILLVTPSGEPGVVQVNLQNYGNIDLGKLPKPAGLEKVYVQPATAMYFSGLSVEAANKQCRELLEKEGWHWFGGTAISFFMRQNAVRVQVICTNSPDTQGKTAVQYAVEQLSSSLPVIKDLATIGYSDRSMDLHGDSKLPPDDFLQAYRKKLESEGWKATTEWPTKEKVQQKMFFRNKANEAAELFYHSADSVTKFRLKFNPATTAAAKK